MILRGMMVRKLGMLKLLVTVAAVWVKSRPSRSMRSNSGVLGGA